MPTILELLNGLPDDMLMIDHTAIAPGTRRTVADIKARTRDTSAGYEMTDSPYNYGRSTRKVIYYPGAGMIYSEATD